MTKKIVCSLMGCLFLFGGLTGCSESKEKVTQPISSESAPTQPPEPPKTLPPSS